jgi:hypothetical protein
MPSLIDGAADRVSPVDSIPEARIASSVVLQVSPLPLSLRHVCSFTFLFSNLICLLLFLSQISLLFQPLLICLTGLDISNTRLLRSSSSEHGYALPRVFAKLLLNKFTAGRYLGIKRIIQIQTWGWSFKNGSITAPYMLALAFEHLYRLIFLPFLRLGRISHRLLFLFFFFLLSAFFSPSPSG